MPLEWYEHLGWAVVILSALFIVVRSLRLY